MIGRGPSTTVSASHRRLIYFAACTAAKRSRPTGHAARRPGPKVASCSGSARGVILNTGRHPRASGAGLRPTRALDPGRSILRPILKISLPLVRRRREWPEDDGTPPLHPHTALAEGIPDPAQTVLGERIDSKDAVPAGRGASGEDKANRRIEAEEKTKGGIIIPDTAKEKPQEGEVIAVGPGARDESGKIVPLDVKVGDRVLFGKWSGTEVRIDGRTS